ncbi:MAG: hypothetical protein WBA07_26445 [Rivularia sp. (in: cyanobacteria)]
MLALIVDCINFDWFIFSETSADVKFYVSTTRRNKLKGLLAAIALRKKV